MPMDNNRLLLEIDKTIREVNREVINPSIPELTLDDLTPVMALVAPGPEVTSTQPVLPVARA